MSGSGVTFDHPAAEAVAGIAACLDALAEANLWSLPTAELGRLLVAVEVAARRIDAVRVELTAQAEIAQLARREGATSLAALLRARADVPPSLTRDRLRLHTALARRNATRAAFAAGVVGQRAATAVCDALDQLPPAVPAAMTGRVEELLLQVAEHDGTAAVARAAMGIVHRFAPDELEAREARAAERDRLAVRLLPDGGITLRGRYGVESAAHILPVLGAHATPRGRADGMPDTRDTETRQAEALVDICRAAAAAAETPTVRGEPPHVMVTVPLAALLGEPGAPPGMLGHGAPISAGLARRLACDAKIIPVVLGSAGEPLDVGRATRLWPAAIRRALEARDQGCAFPGCDRPATWCDAHHILWWIRGGPTSVANGVLLCRRHHTLVHQDEWHIHLRDGLPWFTPPHWIDPTRTPRQHSRYRKPDDP